jgi:hypothetical protein
MTLRCKLERIAMRSSRAFALAVAVLGRHRAPADARAEWIRYRVRRVCSHPDALHVELWEDVAIVTGPVLEPEHERVVVAAASVPGVSSVRDELSLHAEADVSELQGAPIHLDERRTRWMLRIGRGLLLLFGLGLAWQASRLRRR